MRRVFAWVNQSIFKTAFHYLCGSRLLMRLLGFKMPPLRSSIGFGGVYGDLTTFLLGRKLRTLIPERGVRRAHEIGVGPWGTLSIYVRKRFPHVALSASTIAPVQIENAGRVARANGVSFNIIESDVLNAVPGEFDLIWWNLPYYEADVDEFIDRLFRQVHEKRSLAPGGVVMLGFNGIPLPLDRVLALAAKHPHMTVRECVTYAWNPHVLFIAEHRPVPSS